MSTRFPINAKARADISAGALYAVDGGSGWIYYGQYGTDGTFACLRYRSSELSPAAEVLRQTRMFRVSAVRPTVPLREGRWLKMGRYPLHESFAEPFLQVQWPVASLMVTVWQGGNTLYDTRVDDPRIQDFEVMSAWGESHLLERLAADYGAEPAAWHVGGPVWRERRVKKSSRAASRTNQEVSYRKAGFRSPCNDPKVRTEPLLPL